MPPVKSNVVLKYPGSKGIIAEWIVSHFPRHESYLEPFFGSGAIFSVKPRAIAEIVNDLDDRIANLFRVIRDQPRELAESIFWTPYSRNELLASFEGLTGDPVEDARRFLVQSRQSMACSASDCTTWKVSAIPRPYVGSWSNLPGRILEAAERYRGVQVECRPALDLIGAHKTSDVLIYADPPYLPGTWNGGLYRHEMTIDDHEKLLDALNAHPGPVLLSGYQSDLYDEKLATWGKVTMSVNTQANAARTEVLWLNPVADQSASQLRMDLL